MRGGKKRGMDMRRIGVGGGSGADCGGETEWSRKVSAQRGQQRRKYHSCMEGRYITPHSTLCSEKREEEEEEEEEDPPQQRQNRGWRR